MWICVINNTKTSTASLRRKRCSGVADDYDTHTRWLAGWAMKFGSFIKGWVNELRKPFHDSFIFRIHWVNKFIFRMPGGAEVSIFRILSNNSSLSSWLMVHSSKKWGSFSITLHSGQRLFSNEVIGRVCRPRSISSMCELALSFETAILYSGFLLYQDRFQTWIPI